jgi:hypothetical protein
LQVSARNQGVPWYSPGPTEVHALAVYETPADAAGAILVGLPRTAAVQAAGGRDPDFRLSTRDW